MPFLRQIKSGVRLLLPGSLVAGLALWATYPLPRRVIPLADDVNWFLVDFQNERHENGLQSAMHWPWVHLLMHRTSRDAWETNYDNHYIVHAETGQHSPRIDQPYSRDCQFRWMSDHEVLFAHIDVSEGRDGQWIFELQKLDLTTNDLRQIVAVPGYKYAWNRDGTRLVVARTGDNRPLEIDRFDGTTGELLRTRFFPHRLGVIARQDKRCAALEWTISPNGRYLLLTEAWNGLERVTPLGLELWDLETGQLVRRYTDYGPPCCQYTEPEQVASKEVGASNIVFYDDDRIGFCVRHRYKSDKYSYYSWLSGTEVYQTIDRETGRLVAAAKKDPVGTTGSRDQSYIIAQTPDRERRLWIHGFPRWELKRLRVTGGGNHVLSYWYEFPEEICSVNHNYIPAGVVSHAEGTCVLNHSASAPRWMTSLHDLLPNWAKPYLAAGDTHRWYWFDGKSRRCRPFRDIPYDCSSARAATASGGPNPCDSA